MHGTSERSRFSPSTYLFESPCGITPHIFPRPDGQQRVDESSIGHVPKPSEEKTKALLKPKEVDRLCISIEHHM